jgi:hypothetical protein
MAYDPSQLNALTSLISRLPQGSKILDLGAQVINADVPTSSILACLEAIHGSRSAAENAFSGLRGQQPWSAGELFRNSPFTYRCIDLYPGEFTIVADLNIFCVPENERGSYDLIMNCGTTEHVADQINCFRAIHDYAAVGATIFHAVPFSGYFNHCLYSYHPNFFVFLAQANDYEIEQLILGGPHAPYKIDQAAGTNTAAWSGLTIYCGMIGCQVRKKSAAPFKLFTHFDDERMASYTPS